MDIDHAFDILLVEDNPADAGLFEALFQQACRKCLFHVVTDGEEATDFLFQRARWKTAPRPKLIILDINIPKIDGKDVLREIKSDKSLRPIPVIILTSSESETDISLSYEYGANCVLIKPSNVDSVAKLFQSLEEFWVNQVRYPSVAGC